MQKNEVEKYLQRLIMEMKKRKTVKNILIAEDIKAVYYEEKETLSDKLLGLCREVNQYKEEGKAVFEHLPSFICSSNVIEFCFILVMADDVNENNLVRYWIDIIYCLKQVTDGNLKVVAKKFEYLFYEEKNVFLDYSEEEILNKVAL